MSEQREDDEFSKLTSRFVEWLEQNNTTISPKIELADLRESSAGRGVLAKEDIDEDEELFSLPRSSILTVDNSSLPSNLKTELEEPWFALVLAMVFEYQLAAKSKWKPYFDLLPTELDTLIYWSEQELEGLQGSAVILKTGKEDADAIFKGFIVPIVKKYATTFDAELLTDDEILALCHRMASTIMAYAFDLERPPNEEDDNNDGWEVDSDASEVLVKGMVPLADMLNADADRNNAKLFYEDDKVVMKSIEKINKGDEIFNDYGQLPSADLLRRYGYVSDNYAQYDVVEISMNLIKECAKDVCKDVDARTAYFQERGMLDDGYDIARAETEYKQFPEELSILLNALTMPGAEFERMKTRKKLPKPNFSNDALKLLYDILVLRRAMYPELSTTQTADTKSERRRILAAKVIQGEKIVLKEAAEAVSELLGPNKKRKTNSFEDDALNLQQSPKRKKEKQVG